MTRLKIIIRTLLLLLVQSKGLLAYDINVIGPLNPLNSISRHTESFIKCLSNESELKVVSTKSFFCTKYSQEFSDLVQNKQVIQEKLSGVSVFCHVVNRKGIRFLNALQNDSLVKLGYCVTECTQVPQWIINQINQSFDAIVVADEWLVKVYKSSGVKLPIFVLPLCLDLEEFLIKNTHKQSGKDQYVFGFSSGIYHYKNHSLLIRSFAHAFKNDPNVKLIIHTRFGQNIGLVESLIAKLRATNIELLKVPFSRKEYIDFISSLDCYVSFSKAEGFSVIPREALAAGVPCILSDNTAQSTICSSGLIYAVPARIKQKINDGVRSGYVFDTRLDDAVKAFKAVYNNFEKYSKKAQGGKEWVRQYCIDTLKPKYLSLVKPKKVILSDCNTIGDAYIKTDSVALYEKYQKLLQCDKQ